MTHIPNPASAEVTHMAATWVSATVSNPSANQVLCDSGGITVARVYFSAIVNSSLASTFLVERVDSSNAVIDSQDFNVLANGSFVFPEQTLAVNSGDKIRVVVKSALLATVSASLFWGDA